MSTPRNFLCHDVAFDMRKPDGYSGLSDPKPDEFIVMLQHTSLRPAYEGVSHFGATVVDQHNTEHVRESCEVRMVASFTIPGESEIIPETSEWQRYRYAGGQIFYANDYQQKTAWMPPDQRLFRSVNKEVFQRVYHQLNHSKRAPPIPWLKLKEHLSDQRVYKLKSY